MKKSCLSCMIDHRRRVNEVIHYYLTGSPLGVDNDGDIQLTEE